MKDVSVIVPSWMESGRLVRCLESLAGQTVRDRLQIVVSRDGGIALPEGAEQLTDLVVNGPHRGPAAARNRGWRAAEGDLILFTDSDCTPEPDWAEEMINALEAGADAVKGVYSGGGTRVIQRLAQVEFLERYILLGRSTFVDMIDTYSAGFRRRVLEEADGFDESFPVADHEDVDLSYRLASMGKKLVFAPEAAVGHLHRSTWPGYFRLKFSRGKWRLRVVRSFPEKAVSDSYTPVCLKLQMILTLLLLPALALLPLTAAPAAGWVLIFTASCAPLAGVALKTDPALTLLVPAFAAWRGLALTSGSIAGILSGRR